AASTAPPTADSYSAPTPKVRYDAGASGFNTGRDSAPAGQKTGSATNPSRGTAPADRAANKGARG
ncbi:CAMK2A, partial [Symbiodinium sp. KB8]